MRVCVPLCMSMLWLCVRSVQGDFVQPPPGHSQRSLAEEETVLPCRYLVDQGDVLVQVTWYKEQPGGTKDQIIVAHRTEGQTAFGTWSGRVRFQGSDPTVDSSLVIMSTEVSDEGTYHCHISTFPTGNFERELSLTVWTVPISSLDPVIMREGQPFSVAASCRSVARPAPSLSWDTELNGLSSNRTSDGGAVSSHYSLHPLRSMNGKQLDCLVWHPALKAPRRLSNRLEVHYPPDAEVEGFNQNWYVGLEFASLTCVGGGNPRPQSFTWIRKGGALPEGVIPHANGTLEFGRPLSLADAGLYQCAAKNLVGTGKAEVEVTVAESHERLTSFDSLLMIIIGGVAGGLLFIMLIIVITVTCHHRRKNKKLVKELVEKKEELSTLSRQASFRRINSVSTDVRGPMEEHIPLRVEGTLRTSLSSLGDQPHCRDSRSTISGSRGGGGGGGGGLDYLGRPIIHNNSRRGRDRVDRDDENRLRVESYVRNSSMSLEGRMLPPLIPSSFPVMQSNELLRPLNGSAILPADVLSLPANVNRSQQHSPMGCTYPPPTEDEDDEDEGLGEPMRPSSQERPDDQDSETNCSQTSDALSSRYQPANGTLRPKPRPSPVNPHASIIHKAQIV